MAKKIETTGELRQFIADLIVKVEAGDVDGDKARAVTRLAAQINDSFYAEIKVAKMTLEAGGQCVALGKLAVCGERKLS
jgi:hypothetical protein